MGVDTAMVETRSQEGGDEVGALGEKHRVGWWMAILFFRREVRGEGGR